MNVAQTSKRRRLEAPSGVTLDADQAACAAFVQEGEHAAQAYEPEGLLKAKSTEDVQAIIEWANHHNVGILPVSSTGRRRRGDTIPQRAGVYMLDLSGMKRLVHADSRDKIAIVEPGVDFGSVDALLLQHGLRALRPLMPRAGKSLIASYLEREPLISPNDHWDVEDPFGGTHIILGHGRKTPTGTAALEGTLQEQLAHGHRHMVSVGPSNLDLLRVMQGSQGSLAAMTWAAVYCERIPSQERAWFCHAEELAPVINLCREFLHRRLGNALFVVDCVQLAMMLARDSASMQSLLTQLPAWSVFIGISAGRQQPDAKMAWQAADVMACAQQHGVTCSEALGGFRADDLIKILRRSDEATYKDRSLGAHRELFFIQQLDQVSKYVDLVNAGMGRAGKSSATVGVYIQPMAQGVNCHIEFNWAYEKTAQPEQDERLWHEIAHQCSQQGGFFSRPYGRWAEFAYEHDESTGPLMRMTKTILDPKGVMNPGRLPY